MYSLHQMENTLSTVFQKLGKLSVLSAPRREKRESTKSPISGGEYRIEQIARQCKQAALTDPKLRSLSRSTTHRLNYITRSIDGTFAPTNLVRSSKVSLTQPLLLLLFLLGGDRPFSRMCDVALNPELKCRLHVKTANIPSAYLETGGKKTDANGAKMY